MAGEGISTSQAAKELAVTTQTIRNYIDRGLIRAWTLPTGYRRVNADDINRIKGDNR